MVPGGLERGQLLEALLGLADEGLPIDVHEASHSRIGGRQRTRCSLRAMRSEHLADLVRGALAGANRSVHVALEDEARPSSGDTRTEPSGAPFQKSLIPGKSRSERARHHVRIAVAPLVALAFDASPICRPAPRAPFRFRLGCRSRGRHANFSGSAWSFLEGAPLLRVERDASEAADAASAGADAATGTWCTSQRRAHGTCGQRPRL